MPIRKLRGEIPAMAAFWTLAKRGVFALYVAFGIGGSIVSGLVFSAAMGLVQWSRTRPG
jgi:hypothetical protein